jgi:hypothetical protein
MTKILTIDDPETLALVDEQAALDGEKTAVQTARRLIREGIRYRAHIAKIMPTPQVRPMINLRTPK